MKTVITKSLVAPVLAYLSGSRRANLEVALTALRAAEARGAWDGREAQKTSKGFYQGLSDRIAIKVEKQTYTGAISNPEFCFKWGNRYEGPLPIVITGRGRGEREVPQHVVEAWIQLCNVAGVLRKQLDAARPKPVVTAVGLSPKVTKTLLEMNLDIDLPSITPAKIVPMEVQDYDKHHKPMFTEDGKPVMKTIWVVEWSEGCKFNQSRFTNGCQACGKPIPSGRYVPIEADCKKVGRIGLWIGCDCARNIFGVKDKGIEKSA